MSQTAARYPSRAGAVLIVAIAHLLFIDVLVTSLRTGRPALNAQPFQVLILRRPQRQPPDLRAPKMAPAGLTHAYAPITPIPVEIALETPPQPAMRIPTTDEVHPEQAAPRSPSSPGIAVIHGVRPIVPAASIRSGERGIVLVAVLVDEQGRASELRVLRSTGYHALDQSAVAAIRQWRFSVPRDGARAIRAWTRVEWQFAPLPPELSHIALSVLPFEAAMAAGFREAALRMNGLSSPAPRGAQALRRLINALREFEQRAAGPMQSAQNSALPIEMLGGWGAVMSLQFRGSGSGGLSIPFEQGVEAPSSVAPEHTSWERYEVTQQGGVSEWLLAVQDSGAIQSAQAMTCTQSCADP
ncbi:MAG TPA: energy transducer TonB [Steroidobacteraceae bacterium]|nr:energy transducer TonB [Steroidobacteraceae bacterium]